MIYLLFIIALLLVALKIYMKLTIGRCQSNAVMNGKTVIITGSSSGIGKETARDLARRGGKIILACRNLNKANEVVQEIRKESNNRSVYALKLNLASLKSVRMFVEEFNEKEERLDVLINNAGIYPLDETIISEDGIELTFQSNHFGHFLLTLLLLPKLKSNELATRIINVSSGAHIFVRNLNFDHFTGKLDDLKYFKAFALYAETKLCNIFFTKSLADRLKNTSITVNCLHPGVAKTEIIRNFNIFQFIFSTQSPFYALFQKSVQECAQTTISLAVDPKFDNISGEYFSDCKIDTSSRFSKNKKIAEKLWNESVKITRFKESKN